MALSSGRRDMQALAAKRPAGHTSAKSAQFGALRSTSDLVDVRPHLLSQRSGSTISARHLQETSNPPQGVSRAGQLKGHQRRPSVARLLPDISKLRLLSWLVEASSELINCDIAIMDGVYAKLNRSQESLLFWTSSSGQTVLRPPAPPRAQPVANPLVISQHLKQRPARQVHALNAGRNHHSLPITNCDASSLVVAACPARPEARVASKDLLRAHQAQLSAGRSASLPSGNQNQAGSGSHNCSDCEDDLHAPAEENDDADSSASSTSTSSSGIHGEETSLSSSASSQSSAGEPISRPAANRYPTDGRAQVGPRQPQAGKSSAEQLSEKIRCCVLEHNHLQSLLVNIIRQHDKQRDQQRQRDQKISALGNSHLVTPAPSRPALRIDLADIAESLDDGCSCSCHLQRRSSSLDVDTSLPVGCTANKLAAEEKSSTLPRPRSVDISSNKAKLASLVRQQLKQQQKHQRNANKTGEGRDLDGARSISSSNRKEMINLLADKLCENCFETHYWLHGCLESQDESHKLLKASGGLLSSTGTQVYPTDGSTSTLGEQHQQQSGNDGGAANYPGVANKLALSLNELNAIIAKRNATFIKLVQQEVRSTITKAIDLIDLIRREIKSPEYIKQKQLMKCFSSSIQLLTSVSNYVVPSQDISSFIPDDMIEQQQPSLFKLPSHDFDHLLSGYQDSGASVSASGSSQFHNIQSRQQAAAYHLAPAPEIPIRRRVNHLRSAIGSNISRTASCNDSIVGSVSSTPSLPTSLTTTTTSSNTTATTATATTQLDNNNLGEQRSLNLDQSISSWDQQRRQDGCELLTNEKTTPTTAGRAQASPVSGSTAARATTEISSNAAESSSSGASSNNSSASSSIARGAVQQSSLTRSSGLPGSVEQNSSLNNASVATSASRTSLLASNKVAVDSRRHDLASLDAIVNLSNERQQTEEDLLFQSRPKFWQSSKFNFIKKLLHVKQQRLLRQQSKDRRIYNNKVQSKFRLVMMDLTHFNKSQQLLTTENGVNSLLTSMRNVLEFGLYLTLKLY